MPRGGWAPRCSTPPALVSKVERDSTSLASSLKSPQRHDDRSINSPLDPVNILAFYPYRSARLKYIAAGFHFVLDPASTACTCMLLEAPLNTNRAVAAKTWRSSGPSSLRPAWSSSAAGGNRKKRDEFSADAPPQKQSIQSDTASVPRNSIPPYTTRRSAGRTQHHYTAPTWWSGLPAVAYAVLRTTCSRPLH